MDAFSGDGMIHLLHGSDDYRVRRALHELRDELRAADDMLDSNTTVLQGAGLTPQELLAHATAVPFLAAHRLVIVEGLLGALGEGRRGRKKKAEDDPLEPWRHAVQTLGDPAAIPETTTLVFVEGALNKTNAAFPLFAPIARTVEYGALEKGELAAWIAEEAGRRGVKLAPRSVAALAQLIGPDLWTLANELDKLAAYAGDGVVEPELIADMVPAAQETNIWELTDGIVAGDEKKALGALSRLLGAGEPAPLIAFMVVRQFRQIALVKDMRDRRVRNDEITRTTGMKGYRLDTVGKLATRYTWPQLREAYALLLESDLSVKRGLQDDESALQLVVHELCARAPRGGVRPAYAR